jgi:hypothetical protein
MRAFRIEPDKWKQFQDVAREADERTASQQLRYMIDQYLAATTPTPTEKTRAKEPK